MRKRLTDLRRFIADAWALACCITVYIAACLLEDPWMPEEEE